MENWERELRVFPGVPRFQRTQVILDLLRMSLVPKDLDVIMYLYIRCARFRGTSPKAYEE